MDALHGLDQLCVSASKKATAGKSDVAKPDSLVAEDVEDDLDATAAGDLDEVQEDADDEKFCDGRWEYTSSPRATTQLPHCIGYCLREGDVGVATATACGGYYTARGALSDCLRCSWRQTQNVRLTGGLTSSYTSA